MNVSERTRKWQIANPERYKANLRKTTRKLRREALALLGDKCVMCGYSDERALCIDHVNGGGKKELSKIGSHGVARKVRDGATGYQLLCANCNMIKMKQSR